MISQRLITEPFTGTATSAEGGVLAARGVAKTVDARVNQLAAIHGLDPSEFKVRDVVLTFPGGSKLVTFISYVIPNDGQDGESHAR